MLLGESECVRRRCLGGHPGSQSDQQARSPGPGARASVCVCACARVCAYELPPHVAFLHLCPFLPVSPSPASLGFTFHD